MHRYVTIIFLLCCYFHVSSQSTKLRNKRYNVALRNLPLEPLPADYASYSISIINNSNYLESKKFPYADIEKNLEVVGFTRVPKGGDFHVELTMDAAVIGNREIQKVSEGEKVYYKMTICQPTSIKIVNRDQDVLLQETVASCANPHKMNTRQYASKADLDKGYPVDAEKEYYSYFEDILAKVAREIWTRYSYTNLVREVNFDVVTNKKHPDFQFWQEAMEDTEKAIKAVTANEIEDREMLIDVVRRWEEHAMAYDVSDKKQKSLRISALGNASDLARIAEDFDYLLKLAAALDDLNKSPGFEAKMKEWIDGQKLLFAKNGVTSTHYVRAMPELAENQKETSYGGSERETAFEHWLDTLTEKVTISEATLTLEDGSQESVLYAYFTDRYRGAPIINSAEANMLILIKHDDGSFELIPFGTDAKIKEIQTEDYTFRTDENILAIVDDHYIKTNIYQLLIDGENITLFQNLDVGEDGLTRGYLYSLPGETKIEYFGGNNSNSYAKKLAKACDTFDATPYLENKKPSHQKILEAVREFEAFNCK